MTHFPSSSVWIEDTQANPLENSKSTMFAVHPHGIFCCGWSCLVVQDFMKDTYFCFATALYYSPFFRLFSRLTMKPSGVSKKGMKKIMQSGSSLALIPGGFEEASIHSIERDRLFLKNRRGFTAYACKYGYKIRPVYAFGERQTFCNFQGFWSIRFFLNSFGIPGIIPFGSSYFPILPKQTPMNIVFGKPVELPKGLLTHEELVKQGKK